MNNPELEGQLNALPQPYHVRRAAVNDGYIEMFNTPVMIAKRRQEQRQAQEAMATMPIVESEPVAYDQMQNRENVVILDDHRDRSVTFARDQVIAAFEEPESGYVQETA